MNQRTGMMYDLEWEFEIPRGFFKRGNLGHLYIGAASMKSMTFRFSKQ
jgi:hypothetical protein